MARRPEDRLEIPFLRGGGETGALIRAHDWAATPLGPVEGWPSPLKTAVGLMLGARQPVYVAYGPELTSLYNDGYLPIVGTKHPGGLGEPFAELWSEIWDDFRPIVEATMAGDAQHFVNLPIALGGRPGLPVGYFTFSYTALRDDDGEIAGFYCAATETTDQVLAEERRAADAERQRMMLQQMPGFAALLAGPEHRFEYVNDAYLTIAGERDFVGRTVREAFPELEGQGFFELLDRVYATGEPFVARSMGVRLAQQDGERFIDLLYEPIRDAAGRVTGIFVGGYDNTERTRAELALRKSEARLSALEELSDRLRPTDDPDNLPHAAAEILGRALDVSRVGYGTIDDATETLHVERDWTAPGVQSLAGVVRLRDYGSFIDSLRRDEFVAIGDVREDERTAAAADALAAYSARSFVNVPVVERGRLVAVLYVNHAEVRDWQADELALIREVADRTRTAVQRHRNEAALRESEARYRTLFDTIDEGFCVIEFIDGPRGPSSDYVHVDANPAYALHAGIENVVGQKVREMVPDEADGWIELYGRVLATGESIHFERELVATGRHLELSAFRVEPASRCQVAVLFKDITAGKQAEEALRQSEERYRTLFEAIDAGFCIVEMKFEGEGRAVDYRLTEINPAFERQTGLVGAEGKWVSEAAPGLERHWFDTYGHVALTGEAVRFENRAEPFGRWYDVHAFRIGAAGAHRVAILFNDITDRIDAEDRLHQLNETLEQHVAERTKERDRLWVLSEDMLARADYAGNLSAVNPAWTKVLGWSERKLLTDPYAEIIHPDNVETVVAALEEMARTGQPTRFENRILTAGGEWKPIGWTVSPEPNGVYFIAVGRDLTEDKARERELLYAQEALRQSQKMEAMGSLTGGVAHDFNNLLTPIIGSLDMLQRRRLGGEREQRLIGGALQSADRAKTLVQRLLAFARRQPLKATAVDLGKLLEGMAELVASTSGPQINVVVHVPDALQPAYADPNQLEMAILNLAVNARDAMPQGGTLTLSAAESEVGPDHRSKLPHGNYLSLCVTDTGTGMDEAILARAIEPFFSTKGIGKGTGLGLSMVHGLASQLGGAMTLASKPGFGTKVELWLPVSSLPVPQDSDAANSEQAPAGAGLVLLVDDEAIVRTSTADMLGELGYAVVEAESAAEVLKLLDGGLEPDLMLTDHLMPGMTGTDLAREVRGRWPDRPILLISGFAEAEGVAPDLPRLTKPFRQAELAAMLAALT